MVFNYIQWRIIKYTNEAKYMHIFSQRLGKQFHCFIFNFSSALFSFRKGKKDNLITRTGKWKEARMEWKVTLSGQS